MILEADASGSWLRLAYVANWIIWGVFAFELGAVMTVAARKRAALRAHWLNVAIVLLTLPLFGAFLSSLRFIRLARMLRLLRAFTLVGRALQAERRLTSGAALRLAAITTIFVVVVAGAAQAALDAGEFQSVWNGVWWAAVTVTTVGYGDITPHTVAGRLIAMAIMLIGIGFLSVLTATIASRFVRTDTNTDAILESLRRLESEVAEMRKRLPRG